MAARRAADLPEGDPFGALGDGNRREIVRLLRGGACSVQDLADRLPISRPAVSRHLRILEEAGLVSHRADGTRHLYRLDDIGLREVHEYLTTVWGDAATRFKLFSENVEEP